MRRASFVVCVRVCPFVLWPLAIGHGRLHRSQAVGLRLHKSTGATTSSTPPPDLRKIVANKFTECGYNHAFICDAVVVVRGDIGVCCGKCERRAQQGVMGGVLCDADRMPVVFTLCTSSPKRETKAIYSFTLNIATLARANTDTTTAVSVLNC
mgnify:CR=1 FL=1